LNATRRFIIVISLLIGTALACNLPLSATQKTSKTPTPLDASTSITETATPTSLPEIATLSYPTRIAAPPRPTKIATAIRPAQTPVPTFGFTPTSTPLPDETNSFCRNKRPTVLIFTNPNATYQLMDAKNLIDGRQILKTLANGDQVLYVVNADGRTLGERVRCFDNGFKTDGRKIVACIGIVKMSFEINICDPTRPNCIIYKLTLLRCPGCISW